MVKVSIPTPSVALIIPTKDRYGNLRNLFRCLENSGNLKQIVVVDASENFSTNELPEKIMATRVTHINSRVASAAVQRNIGLDYVNSLNAKFDYVAFLDDDVIVGPDYFSQLIQVFLNKDVVGASGVAVANQEMKNLSSRKFLRVILESIGYVGVPGSVTPAAINIPVLVGQGPKENVECDWLIACSIWKWPSIKDLRFEGDFLGASIFEDVIFSIRARSRGKLFVNPNVVLKHLLLSASTSLSFERNRQWAKNRYKVREILPRNFISWKYCAVNVFYMINLLFRKGGVSGSLGVLVGTFQGILKR